MKSKRNRRRKNQQKKNIHVRIKCVTVFRASKTNVFKGLSLPTCIESTIREYPLFVFIFMIDSSHDKIHETKMKL